MTAQSSSDSSIKLTHEQIAHIRRGLDHNSLFRYLDEDQRQALVAHVKLQEYAPGSVILQEQDLGDQFYIIEEGTVSVVHDREGEFGQLTAGESFGEKAMMFDTRRSASVIAATPTKCWTIDRPTFHKVLTSSPRKREVFDYYATKEDPSSHERVMRPPDFLRSLVGKRGLSDDEVKVEVAKLFPKMSTIMNFVDRNKSGNVDFLEYCLFDVIASKPDPFFDFAFLMFDTDKKGYVSQKDVKSVLEKQANLPSGFDFDCAILKRFFGDDGSRHLRFLAFSEFFLALQEEIPRQAFIAADVSHSGKLSGDQLVDVVNRFGHWRMPPAILERILTIKGVSPEREGATYAEFIALNNMLNHLPSVMTILQHAAARNGGISVSKDEFLRSAQMLHSVRPSPMELKLIYDLFDTSRTGFLTANQFIEATGLRSYVPTPAAVKASEQHISPLREAILNFMVGSVAGGVGATVVYPIDFVKTRLQNQPYDAQGKGTLYSGIVDCFRKTVRHEGFLGLYRGVPAQLVGVAPEKAIKLATNDLLRGLFSNDNKPINLPLEILAGGCAGAMQVFFTNPYELIKIRLQIQGAERARNPAFVPQSAMSIVREMGFTGLYRGASACWMRDIPFSAIYFPVYAHTKKTLSSDPPTKLDLLLSGAIAGCPAAYLCTPADVIKTRLQADRKGVKPRFTGLRDCFTKTVREEGWKTLFVGGGMRVFRSSPQFAVTLLVYEMLQKSILPDIQKPRPMSEVPISAAEYSRATYSNKLLFAI